MKQFLVSILVTMIFFSCAESEKKKSEESKDSLKVEIDSVSENIPSEKIEASDLRLKPGKELRLKLLLDSFDECRQSSTNRTDCRHWASRVICEYCNIGDFKNEYGDYYYFDSILPIIKRTSEWQRVGVINTQEVSDAAQSLINKGQATLAIDTSVAYGLVTLLIPGEMKHSSTWNIDLPKCVYMNHTKKGDAFVDKPLSYAYKSPNSVVVYSRLKD